MSSDWVTVQPSLDPILEPVNAILAPIDGLLSALLAILNIVQTILNIIKAFLVGLLDPLKAIIKAIIQEIRNIIRDLKQLGLYLHYGDIQLIDIKNNFQNIRGGFNAYERRMIARLTDKRDLNRPNFSSSSAALAFFVYTSGQDVDVLVRTITQIVKFLTGEYQPVAAAFPQPTGLSVTYGDGTGSWSELGEALSGGDSIPQKAIVKWKMPSGPGGSAGFMMPAPKGWIIEVSTTDGGLQVVGATPSDRNAPGLYPTVINSVGIDPVTNGVLTVYGGPEMVGSESADYSDVWPPSPNDPRAVKWFFRRDTNTPLIPPKALGKSNGGPWLGQAFFVPNSALLGAMPGQEFRAIFDVSMLPKDADIVQDADNEYGIKLTERTPSSYFFRVRAVGAPVKDAIDAGSPLEPHPMTDDPLRLYKFTKDNVRQASSGRLTPTPPSGDVGPADFGVPSQGLEVIFPGESAVQYQQAIQLALIVMLLSRCDAKTAAETPETFSPGIVLGSTGMEEVVQKLNPLMKVGPKFFTSSDTTNWRATLYLKTLAFSQALYEMASLSETLMASVVELAEPLFTTTWKDCDPDKTYSEVWSTALPPAITIAQSFGIGSEEFEGDTPKEVRNNILLGVAPNPLATPVSSASGTDVSFYVFGGPKRSPGFMEKEVHPDTKGRWASGDGSLDSSPVVYSLSSNARTIQYCAFARNLLLNKPELLSAAASVLKVTGAVRSPQDGSWTVWRPFYAMLAPLEQILQNIEDWLEALLAAMEGVVERIVAFIEAVQARIYQLQALIEWIRSLLKSLDFALPSASGLVVVANGTDGILVDLLSAENKPSDDPQAMGAGLVVVAGGLPNLLLDLLGAMFSAGPAD